jgi:hypothetical protein
MYVACNEGINRWYIVHRDTITTNNISITRLHTSQVLIYKYIIVLYVLLCKYFLMELLIHSNKTKNMFTVTDVIKILIN